MVLRWAGTNTPNGLGEERVVAVLSRPVRESGSGRMRSGYGSRVAPVVTAPPPSPKPDEDAELVERARAGEAEAFGEIVRRHSSGVHRVAAGMVGRDEAEDVAQETFMRAVRGIARFEGRSSLRSWLYGIASRVALQRLRKKRRWSWLTRLGEHDPRAPLVHPGTDLVAGERQSAIEAAIAALPDHQRAVVVLRAYEGLSYAEISKALGIRRPTAESRMARARQTLRHELGSWLEATQ
jgi:RNA polymerase sigma-70 factor (ECF subfamily)